jgi:dTDP-4-dehydrorhamnose 3,5-epimerase
MRFRATPHALPGLLIIEGSAFPDERGYFMESFRADELAALGLPPFVQDNLSRSSRGTLRGLHYQKAARPVGKLVRCLRGRIFDVVVDIRKASPTFGRWTSVELSDAGNRMFWVPAGFAHGFLALSDSVDVCYKVTDYWSPDVDAGIRWDDPAIGIKWPQTPALVSSKDAVLPVLGQAELL